MSNKTVFVPVDPEGFGCGLLLGLIINYWRELLIGGALIFGCIFGVNVIGSITSSISAAKEANAAATQSIIQSMTEVNRQALLNNAFLNIRQFKGMVQLGNGQGIAMQKESEYVRVNAIEFSSSNINVYFDSYTTLWWGGSPPTGPEHSCIYMNGPRQSIYDMILSEPTGYQISPKTWYGNLDTSTPISYDGYLSYSSAIFSTDVSLIGNDTNLYFLYQCGIHHPPGIAMIDILDFAVTTEAPAESAATEAPVDIAPTEAPVATEAPVLNDMLSFVYPVDGQILDYEGSYLFKVTPVEGADGYLWGFFKNGVMVWENLRDEGELSGVEYGIYEGSFAHSQFTSGYVEVWVRASIYGEWTEPTVITIYLKPQ